VEDSIPQSWWVISAETLMDMLWKAFRGEDPDLVYAEHYANSEVERGPER
jgi:hypothetical protein